MKQISNSDILAKIGEYSLKTPNTCHLNDKGIISIDIKEDTIQSCIDFVHESYPQVEDDDIIQLINNKELQQSIIDDDIKRQLKNIL